jgi:hypothetical protein
MLGQSIVSQHFMEPVGSIPNSQELSTCSFTNDYMNEIGLPKKETFKLTSYSRNRPWNL